MFTIMTFVLARVLCAVELARALLLAHVDPIGRGRVLFRAALDRPNERMRGARLLNVDGA